MGKFILLQYVLRPEAAELANFAPEWTVLCVPSLWLILLLMERVKAILLF
jgi:hypothetical protein